MELRQLRYFVAVAEEGSFGAAAKRVHITQPPLTRQIHALEKELGVELLHRTVRGTVLTEAGHSFLEDARRILAQTQRARDRSRAVGRGQIGHLAVAFFGSPIYSAVPMLLKRLKADLPQVEFTLSVMPHEKQIDALRSELIDIGFSRSFHPEADILIQDVLTESLLIAISTSDPLATRKTLRLADLQRPFILFPARNRPNFSEALLSMLAEKGIVPTVGAEVEDPSTALSLVSVGLGILVVPQSVAAIRMPDVVFIPLAESALRSVIQCAYLKNSTSKILPMFLDLIRERLNAETASRDP